MVDSLRRLRNMSGRAIAVTASVVVIAAAGGVWASGNANFIGFMATGQDDCVDPTPTPAGTTRPTAEAGAAATDGVTMSFSFSPNPLEPGSGVSWSFAVTNSSEEPVTLTLPSSQNGDVSLRGDGGEVYRWSDGRAFTQAIRERELASGETWRFSLEDRLNVEPGSYQLTAEVTSEPAPAPSTRTVQVGGPTSPSPSPVSSPSETGTSSEGTPSPSPTPSATPTATPPEEI